MCALFEEPRIVQVYRFVNAMRGWEFRPDPEPRILAVYYQKTSEMQVFAQQMASKSELPCFPIKIANSEVHQSGRRRDLFDGGGD